jgi:hypothetical protein
MRDVNIDDKTTQRWSDTPEERGKLEKRTASARGGISHWKKPFHRLKPPLSDFLLAGVNTERELNVPVFLHTKSISAMHKGAANRNLLTALEPGGSQSEET